MLISSTTVKETWWVASQVVIVAEGQLRNVACDRNGGESSRLSLTTAGSFTRGIGLRIRGCRQSGI
jgi:hypothetical protein